MLLNEHSLFGLRDMPWKFFELFVPFVPAPVTVLVGQVIADVRRLEIHN